MAARPSILFVLLGALGSLGASFRTQNFLVEAPDPAVAQQVGEYAERYRREKAVQWLGHEMPAWGRPCPLRVTVLMNGAGGATTFNYDGRGGITSIDMHIEGPLDRLLASVLPHEITHTVLAQHFRCPLPRWADEGGSVLSEDDLERSRHDMMVRDILNRGRSIRLRTLFQLRNYPRDVMVLYAEGYSVTNFLVNRSSRGTFLAFVAHGMQRDNWDEAAYRHYGYRSVEDLETAWLDSLRNNRPGQPPALLASGSGRPGAAGPASRVAVHQTLPPAQPLLGAPQPVYRGQAPGPDSDERPDPRSAARPDYPPPPPPAPPRYQQQAPPPGVRLGAPQFETVPPPPPPDARPFPGNSSPVGYPGDR